jgi:hypothetical protein
MDHGFIVGPVTDKNSYTAAPMTLPMYVGRYDLNGDRVWFQELTMDGIDPSLDPWILGIAFDPVGNPVLAVEANVGYLFKLSAADGSVM